MKIEFLSLLVSQLHKNKDKQNIYMSYAGVSLKLIKYHANNLISTDDVYTRS